MGTRNFIFIKLQQLTGLDKRQLKEFCLMQYCQYDGYPAGQGLVILKFLRELVRDNKWDEFCAKCKTLNQDVTSGPTDEEFYLLSSILYVDDVNVALEKIKRAFVCVDNVFVAKYEYVAKEWSFSRKIISKDLFEAITASPESLKEHINYVKAHSCSTGAKILDLIMTDQIKNVVYCDKDWPSNSLFCEWGYLIDITTKELLVYSNVDAHKGMENNPLSFKKIYSAHLSF